MPGKSRTARRLEKARHAREATATAPRRRNGRRGNKTQRISGFELFAELASSGAIKAHFCVAAKREEEELHSVSDCRVAKGAQACVEDLRRRET